MKRTLIKPRYNWMERADEIGFDYHSNGQPISEENPYGTHWDESIAYQFTASEVDTLESATEELNARCLDAVGYVCDNPKLLGERFKIPEAFHDYVIDTWKRRDPTLYGRFDLAYDGFTAPKMLEYNADTPTLLIESALMQWYWLEDMRIREGRKDLDQFNSLHEKIVAQLKYLSIRRPDKSATMWFSGFFNELEEFRTVEYFRDCAEQAGIQQGYIDIKDIGWNGSNFTSLDELPIKYMFKLYPWEWMMTDEFGQHVLKDTTGWVEPAWKAILSNKAILPVLHELFPNHENILPAKWTADGMTNFVAKPILSREGCNIDVVVNGNVVEKTEGPYGADRIFQEKAKLFEQDGNKAVIGSWIIGDKAAGMIIRDSDKDIVINTSKVVPHFFV